MAIRVAEDAVQIRGGNEYSSEYPVEGYFRGAMVCAYTRIGIRSRP